jgi:hypothetical protein
LKKFTAALALACALIVPGSGAAVDFGANDDTGKYSDNPAAFFQQMAGVGMKQNVMTVRWTPGSPAIPDQGFLNKAVPAALAQGVTPVFAVYPYPPSAIEAGAADPAAFGAWLGSLADAYPGVRTYIVGNEPNLNTFWRPQGDGAGTILSAAAFGPFLAAGYDALKPRGVTVLGVGLSPRGELDPDRAGKTAPVAWLKALGEWYRGSGRTSPLMDGFSFHPYPNPSDFTVPLSFAYGWPNASVQELARIKQALADAFDGTGQPRVKLFLDEVGWQVDTSARSEYEGSENVRVTSEQGQAQIYGDLVRFVACDADVAQLNFFGFHDERSRAGWQAGTHWAGGAPRASADAVKTAIGQGCGSGLRTWSPATGVVGAAAEFAEAGKSHSAKKSVWALNPTAEEQFEYAAGVFPAGTSAAAAARELAAAEQRVGKAGFSPRAEVRVKLEDGSYVLAVRLAAWANSDRVTTLVSDPFTVGAGAIPGLAKSVVLTTGALSSLVSNSSRLLESLQSISSLSSLPTIKCLAKCVITTELTWLSARTTAALLAKAPKKFKATLTLKANQSGKPKLKLKGLNAGTYRLAMTIKSGGKRATLTAKSIVVDAKGKVKKAKPAKADKSSGKKPKGKKKK